MRLLFTSRGEISVSLTLAGVKGHRRGRLCHVKAGENACKAFLPNEPNFPLKTCGALTAVFVALTHTRPRSLRE